jgi:hypothetical protein
MASNDDTNDTTTPTPRGTKTPKHKNPQVKKGRDETQGKHGKIRRKGLSEQSKARDNSRETPTSLCTLVTTVELDRMSNCNAKGGSSWFRPSSIPSAKGMI